MKELVARLAAAGTPPDLLADVAEALFSLEAKATVTEQRRAKDRARKSNSAEIRGTPRSGAELQGEALSPHPPLSEDLPPSSLSESIPPKPKRGDQATRLPSNFVVPSDWIAEGAAYRAQNNLPPVDLRLEAERFANHWATKGGGAARKTDWRRTWKNWCLGAKAERNERASYNGTGRGGRENSHQTLYAAGADVAAERGYRG